MTRTNGSNGANHHGADEPAETPRILPEMSARLRARMAPVVTVALRRRVGRVAEEAQLRARLELARVIGDPVDERTLGRKLAERLASRDAEIDAAIELALRTLAHADDPELRHELAGWLEGLGEHGLAASELRKLARDASPEKAASVLVRIGVLHARAGDAHGAQEALGEAAALDEADALSLELLGALAGWAPDAVSPRSGAEAYVRAARRRHAAGDAVAELEDLFRAFELDPSSTLAAAALVAAHSARDRMSAADEVLRAHAAALGEVEAAEVHTRRRIQALERGDLGRALGAALDDRLDAAFDGPGAEAMDDLLVRSSAFETLAVRLEMRAERAASAATSRPAAQRWAELGRLLSGPLASGERAVEAYARSVAADATSTDALHALRALAQKASTATWVEEGLIRAAMGEGAFGAAADPSSRLAAARALAQLADDAGAAPLAFWANGVVLALDADDDRARGAASRFEDASRRHEDEIRLAEQSLEDAAVGDGDRAERLGALSRLLRAAPARSKQHAAIIAELAALRPDDDELLVEALRIAERVADLDRVAKLCRQRLAHGSPSPRVRLAVVSALRRAGAVAEAAQAATGLFDACTAWAYSVAWMTAAAAGDRATRARAIAALAPSCGASVVSVLAALAAEELHASGDLPGARAAAEQACRADGHDARAIRALAAIVPETEGVVAATALDRAAAVAGPTAALCTRLARLLEKGGDAGPALAWARRAVALRPGDGQVVQDLLDRASRLDDVEALAGAIAWLLPQPFPARATADRLAPALRKLAERDPKRAAALARRALDVLGPRHAGLRAALESVAEAAKDQPLRARVVERWIAAGAPAAERGPLLLTLAALHAAAPDPEREVAAYVRAARASVDLSSVRERIESLDAASYSADAELSLLEARA
ncbi:MAG TPA: hypothetical protein VLT33_14710 [Labilithrix sp.]|nr:hypothetical protein [Labilithrix sp.]